MSILDELERLRVMIEAATDRAQDHNAAGGDLPDEDAVEGHDNPDEDTGEPPDHEDDAGLVFIDSFRNVTSVPRRFHKGRKRPRAIARVDTVLIHQTAVKGGFGVSKRLLQRHDGDVVAARTARFRDTPYHGVYSPQDRVSLIQWPAWAYTYHGNGGNRYSVGWAYDGKLPGDELDAAGARASLRHVVHCLREAGVQLRYVEAHRQHSAQRLADPGVEIWAEVVVPLLDELELELRPTHTTGTGKALPEEWITSP